MLGDDMGASGLQDSIDPPGWTHGQRSRRRTGRRRAALQTLAACQTGYRPRCGRTL